MSDSQVTGKVKIELDGGVVESENEAELEPGGEINDSITHHKKTYRMAEADAPAVVKFKMPLTVDVDVVEIQGWKDKTLTFVADTGQRYLVRNAFTVGKVTHGKGSTDVEMRGDPAEKV
jgi:hypothetical protein